MGEHRARPVVGRQGEARAGGGGAGGQGQPPHRPQQSPLQVPAAAVVVVVVVSHSPPSCRQGIEDGTEDQFRSYISFARTLGKKFDLVLDDGRARVAVR